MFHVGVDMGAIQKWGGLNSQCFLRYIWLSANGVGKLSERTIQCKPLISQLMTDAVPRKRARFSDTDGNHFRIGSFDLFSSPYDDSVNFRAGSRSLFSDSDDTSKSPSDCSVA